MCKHDGETKNTRGQNPESLVQPLRRSHATGRCRSSAASELSFRVAELVKSFDLHPELRKS
ncbi:hypothetical protein RISK_005434 [Rhodopirellula islandica]|uniref:Uncharacterized protein n=1 Tax=Rhodopirellula islandica TaxID=595434 RepID=A0A0J1B704_RHOIS|nr:hypothetical protein RISK_005434 [Rhodopirellula islandica]